MIHQSKPKFWDKTAEEFDAIYTGSKKTLIGVILDKWLRKDIYQRLEKTVNIINTTGNNLLVLDVGTGTGRLCVALAKNGHTAVGIDFSPVMLEMASELSRQSNVSNNCFFFLGDMLQSIPTELSRFSRFDIAAALGIMDYIADPLPMLERMASFSPRKIIVTFPREGSLRSYIRQLRYRIQTLDCPLYFYKAEQIRAIGDSLKAEKTLIRTMGELYFTLFEF